MAKNLRQKYKEAKKKLEAVNYKAVYLNSPIAVTNVPIHKIRSARTVSLDYMPSNIERATEVFELDVAKKLVTHLLDNGLINISSTYDPYARQAYVFADIYVADKKSVNAHA